MLAKPSPIRATGVGLERSHALAIDLHASASRAASQHPDDDQLLQMALASAKASHVERQQLVTEVALLFEELQRRMERRSHSS
jgi:hypothetical protein